MKIHRLVSFVSVLGAFSLFGFGCNPFASFQQNVEQKVGNAVTQGIVSGVTGGKVDIDSSGKQVTVKDNATGNVVAYGENVAIPSDFPKDIPLYPGATPIGVLISKSGDHGTSVTLKSSDDSAKVVSWYEGELKTGWKQESSFSAHGTEIRSYTKENAKLAVTITPGDNQQGSMIALVKTTEQ